jgi:type II secretory ATPase GspE/PulE/Tfp pilus assembly ATPase PilB-like protein
LRFLLREGGLEQHQIQLLLTEHQNTQKPFEQLVVSMGFLSGKALKRLSSVFKGVREISLDQALIHPSILQKLPKDFCLKNQCIIFAENTEGLHVAMADVDNVTLRDELAARFSEQELIFYLSHEAEILKVLNAHYGLQADFETLLRELEAQTETGIDEGPDAVTRFVQRLLIESVSAEASDLHFEPEAHFVRVRIRIDGGLKTLLVFHKNYWGRLLVQLKVMADLDVSEQRRPQSGRFHHIVLGKKVDFRLSTHPTIHGENLVIRVLDNAYLGKKIEKLGFSGDFVGHLKQVLQSPQGLLIMTGPTGAGKTTTLYASLSYLSNDARNIMTLEDPVEYEMPLVRQTAVHPEIGFDFAAGVKSLLRQAPDVLLIGEIRDRETAEMSLRAAMTGRFVLATMHAPHALAALERFRDLGVAPEQCAGYVSGLVAQRLIRKLCTACRQKVPASSQSPQKTFFQAKGCPECAHTGYKGRLVIGEIVPWDETLDRFLRRRFFQKEAVEYVADKGFPTLRKEGIAAVEAGNTSYAEVESVLGGVSLSKPSLIRYEDN